MSKVQMKKEKVKISMEQLIQASTQNRLTELASVCQKTNVKNGQPYQDAKDKSKKSIL
jgi:hypothetical protein